MYAYHKLFCAFPPSQVFHPFGKVYFNYYQHLQIEYPRVCIIRKRAHVLSFVHETLFTILLSC